MKRFLLLLVFFSSIVGSALSLLTLRIKQELPSCCALAKADLGYPITYISSEKDLYRVLKCDTVKCPYTDPRKPPIRQYIITNGMIDYYPLAHITNGLFWAGIVFSPIFLLYGTRKHRGKIQHSIKSVRHNFSFRKHEHRIPIYLKRPEMPWTVRPPAHPEGHHEPGSVFEDDPKMGT